MVAYDELVRSTFSFPLLISSAPTPGWWRPSAGFFQRGLRAYFAHILYCRENCYHPICTFSKTLIRGLRVVHASGPAVSGAIAACPGSSRIQCCRGAQARAELLLFRRQKSPLEDLIRRSTIHSVHVLVIFFFSTPCQLKSSCSPDFFSEFLMSVFSSRSMPALPRATQLCRSIFSNADLTSSCAYLRSPLHSPLHSLLWIERCGGRL